MFLDRFGSLAVVLCVLFVFLVRVMIKGKHLLKKLINDLCGGSQWVSSVTFIAFHLQLSLFQNVI